MNQDLYDLNESVQLSVTYPEIAERILTIQEKPLACHFKRIYGNSYY
ncbi:MULTISPECIES: hypothetical protein [Virgibacillus]|nr:MULTISPECIES: hypothetical protein [Virgibacillus]MED3737173.1 hypothetical protein [Virgibacillus pantothenticus]QTY15082.1 hypothetical protein KBP50_14315 [Virgibacillus pantothenticus]